LAAEREAAKRRGGARQRGSKVRLIIAAWHHPETTQVRKKALSIERQAGRKCGAFS
jgi:hypothetical protein